MSMEMKDGLFWVCLIALGSVYIALQVYIVWHRGSMFQILIKPIVLPQMQLLVL